MGGSVLGMGRAILGGRRDRWSDGWGCAGVGVVRVEREVYVW